MSDQSLDSITSLVNLRTRYLRFSTLLEKSDCDPTLILQELEQDMGSLSLEHRHFLINKYLPGFVKNLLDCKSVHYYQLLRRINDFFKCVMRFLVQHMTAATPGALEILRRLLNEEKDFYDIRSTSGAFELEEMLQKLTEEERSSGVGDPEVTSTCPEFVTVRSMSGYNCFYAYNLNYFGVVGGFKALLRLLDSHPPLDQVNRTLLIILQVQQSLHSDAWKPLAQETMSSAMQGVLQASDEDLRTFTKESLKQLASCLESFEESLRPKEHGQLVEMFELETALKCLNSPYLDKRIYGITCIIHIVERTLREEEGHKRPVRKVDIVPNAPSIEMIEMQIGSRSFSYQKRWLESAEVLSWFDSHDLLAILFGDKSHPELLKRSGELVKFLYKHSRFTRELLDRIWTTAFSKHETERDVTVALFKDLVPVLGPEDVNYFFNRIANMPFGQIDSQVLSLIVTFVKQSFKPKKRHGKRLKITIPQAILSDYRTSVYTQFGQDPDSEIDQLDLPKSEVKREPETQVLADPSKPIALGYYPEEPQIEDIEIEPDCESPGLETQAAQALELLWSLCQQGVIARGLKKEAAVEAMRQFQDLLRNYVHHEREKYAIKCIANLHENLSALSSCRTLQSILSSYTSFRSPNFPEETRAQVITRLCKDYRLFSAIYSNFIWVKREFAHRLLDVSHPDARMEDDQRTDTQSSSSADSSDLQHYSEALQGLHLDSDSDATYYEEVSVRLDLLQFLYQNSPEFISPRQISLLWDCLVVNAFSQKEQDDFFKWFSGLVSSWSADYNALDDDTVHSVFTDILLRLDSRGLTSAAFDCFEQFFLHVNKMHGLIEKLDYDGELEVKEIRLLGADALWEHFLQVRNERVSLQASALLKKLYRGLGLNDDAAQADFLIRCMFQVKSGADNLRDGYESDSVLRINRSLSLLSDFIEEFEGETDLNSGPSINLTIQNTTTDAKEPKIFSIKLPQKIKLNEAREQIGAKLIPPKTAKQILILHNGKLLDGHKGTYTLKELRVLDTHRLIITDSGDPYSFSPPVPDPDQAPLDEDRKEKVAQLKGIFGKRDEVTIAALKRATWSVEDAADLLINEEIVIELEKEAKASENPPVPAVQSRLSKVLSDNRDHFDLLFQLLSLGNNSVSAKVWKLLTQIPVNKDLYETLKTFALGWEDLLDPFCLYKLLYSLQIINSMLEPQGAAGSKEEEETRMRWKTQFIEKGGFGHLYKVLMETAHISLLVDEQQLNNAKCLGFLLTVVKTFLKAALMTAPTDSFRDLYSRTKDISTASTQFNSTFLTSPDDSNPSEASLKQEEPEFPTLVKRLSGNLGGHILELVDFQKLVSKLLDMIEDLSLTALEAETIYVIENALGLLLPVTIAQPAVLQEVYSREGFKRSMVVCLLSPFEKLRKSFGDTISGLCAALQSDPKVETQEPVSFFLQVLLDHIPQDAESATEYFDLAAELIRLKGHRDEKLLKRLIDFVQSREILEDRHLRNRDMALGGVITMVQALFEQHPDSTVDFPTLSQSLYSSLFDVPDISNSLQRNIPPKFKHSETRKRGFKLLLLLSRHSESTSRFLLDKFHQIHSETQYRSSYDMDISLKSPTGFVGLKNFGCTCYMNSLLQQLFMMPDFRQGVLDADLRCAQSDLEENVLYQLQVIFANLKDSEKQYYTPHGFLKALRDLEGQVLNVMVQQDVDEFFSLLSDRLETSMKQTRHEKLLRNLMGGTVVNLITSSEAEFPYTSEREEQFLRISLEIKNKKTLQEALDLFIHEDLLEGDNKYFCEQFDRKVNATRRVLIDSLAQTVVIHLKRFEFDYTTSQRFKMNDYCEFPMEINFKPWAQERLGRDLAYYQYKLVGVLVHSGVAEAGHYYSFISDRITGKWFEFNDQVVKDFKLEDLKEECFGGTGYARTFIGSQSFQKSANAYLLVYERVTNLPTEEDSSETASPEVQAVINVSKEVLQTVAQENIDFLRDRQFFDVTYHHFLQDFATSFRFPPEHGYSDYMSESSDIQYSIDLVARDEDLGETREEEKAKLREREANDLGLKLIKTVVQYAFELMIRAKHVEFFKDWLKVIMKLLWHHDPAAIWLLKRLTPGQSTFLVPTVLLEERQSDLRSLFSRLLTQVMQQVFTCERHLFFKYVEVLVQSQSSKLYKRVMRYKAASARFLKYYITDLMTDAKRNWRRFAEYFTGLADLMRTDKDLVQFVLKEEIITRLIEFFMNGNLPFTEDPRLVMGDQLDSLDMDQVVDLLTFFTCQCLTSDMTKTTQFPGYLHTSIEDAPNLSPIAETHLSDFRVYKALALHQKTEPIQQLSTHLAFGSLDFSNMMIEELLILLNSHRVKWAYTASFLKILTSVLFIRDMFFEDRFRILMTVSLNRGGGLQASSTLFEVLYRVKDTNEMYTALMLLWWGDLLEKQEVMTIMNGFKQKFQWVFHYLEHYDPRYLPHSSIVDYKGTNVHLPTELRKVRNLMTLMTEEVARTDSSDDTDEEQEAMETAEKEHKD